MGPSRNMRAAFDHRRVVAALCLAALVLTAQSASATVAPYLNKVMRESKLVVFGRVHDVSSLDEGQLLAARITPANTFKGKTPSGDVQVVQMRSSGARPPLFVKDEVVLAFLVPAQRNSYLRTHVGEGEIWQAVEENGGVLAAPRAGDAALLASLGEQLATVSRGASTAEGRRKLAFDLLRAKAPIVISDAAASLTEIDGLADSLTKDEQRLIEAAAGDDALHPAARAALIRAVGKAGLRSLVAYLGKLDPKQAEVRSALWDALAALGSPLPRETLAKNLADKDPEIRKIAVRELLQRRGAAAIPQVGEIAAKDPDEAVRIAAVELLGATKNPDAVPPLERVFGGESWAVRQAATRALLDIGGEPAREALVRLAFAPGGADVQRYAVVALLISGVKFDDPVMRRIQKEHPDESVRDVATHGIEIKEH